MKALVLVDYGTRETNYATLIRSGQKSIETRTWCTNYRGDLLIICGSRSKSRYKGMAVAVVEVVDCRPMTEEDEERACCPLYPKAKAWILKNHRVITNPFPAKGNRRMSNVYVPSTAKIVKTNLY